MKSTSRLWGMTLLFAFSLLIGGCAEDNTDTTAPSTEAQFVGSDACKPCHEGVWNATEQSGHAHMLIPVANGQRPDGPTLLPDNPPPGMTWADIKYVIGGGGWRARFVGQDGKVVKGATAQYNVPTDQYPAGESVDDWSESITPYDYACFRCHTTGPQDGSDTFAEVGVRCEACHGPGSLHAATPTRASMTLDDSAALCGRCHSRSEGGSPASTPTDMFIHNNDQYGEMRSGPHESLKCVDCHANHSGVRRGQSGGVVKQCADCHAGIQVSHFGDVDCITCHMPYATKSARSRDRYVGDVRTHIFKIHPGPEDQAEMFDDTGAVLAGFGVTLDYVCYQCHRNEEGVGGSNSRKSLQSSL